MNKSLCVRNVKKYDNNADFRYYIMMNESVMIFLQKPSVFPLTFIFRGVRLNV